MNKVQHLLNELHVAADKLVSPELRTKSHDRIEELDAWLTYAGVKAGSGVMPESATVIKDSLTDDKWFQLLEKHRRNHLIISRDSNNNFCAEVREKGVLVIYHAPDLRYRDAGYVNAFLEAMEPLHE